MADLPGRRGGAASMALLAAFLGLAGSCTQPKPATIEPSVNDGPEPATNARQSVAPSAPALPPSASRRTPLVDGCAAGIALAADRAPLFDELASRCVLGMRSLLRTASKLEPGKAVTFAFSLADAGGCVRALAVADNTAPRTTAELLRGTDELHRAEAPGRFGWLGADGPVCLPEPGAYALRVEASESAGVDVGVWQAE